MKNRLSLFLGFFVSFQLMGQETIDQIPIRIINSLIVISATINDSPRKLQFIFDTGAGITEIDSKIADKLNLSVTGVQKVRTSAKARNAKVSEKNKLKLSNQSILQDLSLVIMDLSHLSTYLKSRIDGIIGIDLLQQIITEVNIDQMVMRFHLDDFQYQGGTEPIHVVGLRSNQIGLPIEVMPKFNANPIQLILKMDSGAGNHLTFHNHIVEKYQLIDPQKRYRTRKGFGASATITHNLRDQVHAVQLGPKQWHKIPVVYEVDPKNIHSERQADGLIGQKLLLDFNITYHLAEGVVYFDDR